MKNLSSLCFTTFVFGKYQKFIPYYIYTISKAYPENTYVKIFIEDKLNNNILQALDIIKKKYCNFEIIECNFENINYFDNYKIKGGGTKTLFRWLFDYNYFKEFDYVYYGDVDILIFPEKISILELHKNQIKKFKVPFSNMVRKNEKGELVTRLTGLHFIETKPYFEKMNPVINQILNNAEYKYRLMNNVIRDENLLYNINKEVFDFDDYLLAEFDTPLHGLHMGIARNEKKLNTEFVIEGSSVSIEELKITLKSFYEDPIFALLQKKVFIKELYFLNIFLEINNNLIWKYYYHEFLFTTFFNKVKFKILLLFKTKKN